MFTVKLEHSQVEEQPYGEPFQELLQRGGEPHQVMKPPRTYQKWSEELLLEAANEVLNGAKIYRVAIAWNIPRSTLSYFMKKRNLLKPKVQNVDSRRKKLRV